MKSTRVYNFSIPAGGSFQLPVTGSYFRVMTATDVLEVQGDTFGNIYPLYTGQGLQGQEFRSLNLLNRTGATNNGSILVSDGKFVDDRITGEVSIIDGGKSRSMSGIAFASTGFVTGVASQYSCLQIWNPSGSGKNIVIEQYSIASSTAGYIDIGISTTQLTTALGITPVGKYSGVNNSISIIKKDNLVGYPASFNGFATVQLAALSSSPIFKFSEPMIIKPGFGLTFTGAIASSYSFNIESFEDNIL